MQHQLRMTEALLFPFLPFLTFPLPLPSLPSLSSLIFPSPFLSPFPFHSLFLLLSFPLFPSLPFPFNLTFRPLHPPPRHFCHTSRLQTHHTRRKHEKLIVGAL